ncbi:hypothetical protein A7982_13146 [Minicystis rosea]|nr:hypothetical protein A7982_13146 [Minicystis rosea]
MNPGQHEGDSLLCVARVTWASLATMPLRTTIAQVGGPKVWAQLQG